MRNFSLKRAIQNLRSSNSRERTERSADNNFEETFRLRSDEIDSFDWTEKRR